MTPNIKIASMAAAAAASSTNVARRNAALRVVKTAAIRELKSRLRTKEAATQQPKTANGYGFGNFIGDLGSENYPGLMRGVTRHMLSPTDGLTNMGQGLSNMASGAAGQIGNGYNNMIGSMAGGMQNMYQGGQSAYNSMAGEIGRGAQGLMDNVRGGANIVGNGYNNMIGSMAGGMQNMYEGGQNLAGQIGNGYNNMVGGLAGGMVDGANMLGNAYNGMGNYLGNLAQSTGNNLHDAYQGGKALAGAAAPYAQQAADAMSWMNPFTAGSRMGAAAAPYAQQAAQAAPGILGQAAKFFNPLNGINNAVGALGAGGRYLSSLFSGQPQGQVPNLSTSNPNHYSNRQAGPQPQPAQRQPMGAIQGDMPPQPQQSPATNSMYGATGAAAFGGQQPSQPQQPQGQPTPAIPRAQLGGGPPTPSTVKAPSAMTAPPPQLQAANTGIQRRSPTGPQPGADGMFSILENGPANQGVPKLAPPQPTSPTIASTRRSF